MSNNNKLYLFRTLYYNRKCKREALFFHYLKDSYCSLSSMVEFLKIFYKHGINNTQLINVTDNNFSSISFNEKEINYYRLENCFCLMCKRILKNIEALIIHLKLCHDNYGIYFTRSLNQSSRKKDIHIFCFLLKKGLNILHREDIYNTFFLNFNKIAKRSHLKMIIFELEINLLLSKIKEVNRHHQETDKTFDILSKKRHNQAKKTSSDNNPMKTILESSKLIKKPFFLVKKNESKRNETLYNIPKLSKEKIYSIDIKKKKKKHIIFHKKTKLLKNRYYNSVTGTLYEINDINELPEESSTFEVEDDLFKERENKEIDEYYDISEKDKLFFKLWNNFINTIDSEKYFLIDKKIEKFIEDNYKLLFKNNIQENFIIHLINLLDLGIINTSFYSKVIKFFQLKIEDNNVKYS